MGGYVFFTESQLQAGRRRAEELGPDALAEWLALVDAFRHADANVQAARRAEQARMEAVGMLWPADAAWVYGAVPVEQGRIYSQAELEAPKREKNDRDAAYDRLHEAEIEAALNISAWLSRHVR